MTKIKCRQIELYREKKNTGMISDFGPESVGVLEKKNINLLYAR